MITTHPIHSYYGGQSDFQILHEKLIFMIHFSHENSSRLLKLIAQYNFTESNAVMYSLSN